MTRAQAIYLDRQIFLIRRVRVRARVPLLHLLLVARLGEFLLEVQGLVAVDALVGDGVPHAAASRRLDLAIVGPVALCCRGTDRLPKQQAQSARCLQ